MNRRTYCIAALTMMLTGGALLAVAHSKVPLVARAAVLLPEPPPATPELLPAAPAPIAPTFAPSRWPAMTASPAATQPKILSTPATQATPPSATSRRRRRPATNGPQ